MTKEGVIKSVHHRRKWVKLFGGYCFNCGSLDNLETHHIVKRPKSDEWCNLARLCLFCHMRAEGSIINTLGRRLSPLSLGQVLWLKRRCDMANYNRDRLEQLKGEAMPELETVWQAPDRMESRPTA